MLRRVQSQWLGVFLFTILLLPVAARAQDRGFAAGMGGVTFNTVSGADVAGRAGVNVTPHVAVFGEFGRMSTALPVADQQTIEDSAATLSTQTSPATIQGGVPALYGLGGVRLSGIQRRSLTPYAEAGYGFARLTNDLTVLVNDSDVSSQVLNTTPLTSDLPQTDPLLSIGGGVIFAATPRIGFDLGYRYSRIFAPSQGINTGKAYGAIRVGF